jgi:hypothetical protein
MFGAIAEFVTRRGWLVVLAWVGLAFVLARVAPPWSAVSRDDDVRFFPPEYASVVGQGLLERGFPAARFTEPHEDYAHQHQDVRVENGKQYGDLPRFCDFGYIARTTKVNAATLWSLATAPGTPKDVKVLTAELTNDTELTWAATPGAQRYEVVWRPTVEDAWTDVIRVGDVTRARVDLSKDNVFFGVRSVGRGGRRSPAAFPTPQR